MRAAFENGQSKIHSWSEKGKDDNAFTMSEGLDWAFCSPISGQTSTGWLLYVSGRGAMSLTDLAGDLRFTELLARFIAQSVAFERWNTTKRK